MMENSQQKLFDYVEELHDEVKRFYEDKISLMDGIDPFLSNYCSQPLKSKSFPPVNSCKLLAYLASV